jgi:hypothetical protein
MSSSSSSSSSGSERKHKHKHRRPDKKKAPSKKHHRHHKAAAAKKKHKKKLKKVHTGSGSATGAGAGTGTGIFFPRFFFSKKTLPFFLFLNRPRHFARAKTRTGPERTKEAQERVCHLVVHQGDAREGKGAYWCRRDAAGRNKEAGRDVEATVC